MLQDINFRHVRSLLGSVLVDYKSLQPSVLEGIYFFEEQE